MSRSISWTSSSSQLVACVRLSIYLHGIIFQCLSVMSVHLKQANLLLLDFNAITAPLKYIKDQLASRTTLDQHCVALIVTRLVRKMWKVLTSSNCDVYMGYSVTFMSILLCRSIIHNLKFCSGLVFSDDRVMWEVMNWAKWLVRFTQDLNDSLLELASYHRIIPLQHLWVLFNRLIRPSRRLRQSTRLSGKLGCSFFQGRVTQYHSPSKEIC